MIGTAATGKKIGMSRIDDRIEWLERVFLAYEREMLRRWKDKVERSGEAVEHLLSHDDMVLTVNCEPSTDRRNTPLDGFNATYLGHAGMPQNLEQQYPNSKVQTAPKFSWQRPTGWYREPQFCAACVNQIQAFQSRAKRRMSKQGKTRRAERDEVIGRTNGMIANIQTISEGWFGFPIDTSDERGSFKGATTRDICTKGPISRS